MKKALALIALLSATVFASTIARSQVVGLDFPIADSYASGDNGSYTLGYTFSVTAPVTVIGLAYWDSQADGLADNHTVGLWSTSGSLLASAVVPKGTSTALLNDWRYVDIAPIALGVGEYVVAGSHTAGAGDFYAWSPSVYSTPSDIAFVKDSWAYDDQLVFPTFSEFSGSTAGFFGGNIVIGSVTGAVPEPSTYGLIGAGLLLCFAGARRLKRFRA